MKTRDGTLETVVRGFAIKIGDKLLSDRLFNDEEEARTFLSTLIVVPVTALISETEAKKETA